MPTWRGIHNGKWNSHRYFTEQFVKQCQQAQHQGRGSIDILLQDHQLTVSNTGLLKALDPKRIFRVFIKKKRIASTTGWAYSIIKQICEQSNIQIAYSFENGAIFSNWTGERFSIEKDYRFKPKNINDRKIKRWLAEKTKMVILMDWTLPTSHWSIMHVNLKKLMLEPSQIQDEIAL